MTKYSGNYKDNIDLSAADDVSELVSVTGSVVVLEGATLNAPVLASAGYVVVREGATLNAPKLQEARKVSA